MTLIELAASILLMPVLFGLPAGMSRLIGWVVLLLSVSAMAAPPSPPAKNIRGESIESTNRILLLKTKQGISTQTSDSLALSLGLKAEKHPNRLKQWRQFSLPPGKDKRDIITTLKRSGRFEHVIEPQTYKTQETPNDPSFPQLWGMTNISAPLAWDRIKDAPDVVVAVVDTGIDFNHPDLAANLWTGPAGEHGYVATNGTVIPGGIDDHGHGTHVAGTIGAVGNNSIGVAGVTWRTRIMAIKVLHRGSGSSLDIVNGLEKLADLRASGVPVLVSNHSYGGNGLDPFMEDGFRMLAEADIFAAVAAGNSNTDIDYRPVSPAGFTFNNMVVATAIDSENRKASFSSFGLVGTDIAAPGADILSTTPNNTYSSFWGTSMAAPHVAGVAALLRQHAPHLSASQIRDVILHPASYDSLPQLYQNNTSAKINAWKALNNLDVPSNRPPVITAVSPYTLISNSATHIFSATASDPDGDALRWGPSVTKDFANYIPGLLSKNGFSFTSTNGLALVSGKPFAFQFANQLNLGVSDNRGGAVITNSGFEFVLDRTLRKPIPVKTWEAWTNAGTNSISFVFDVEDTNKTDYSCILSFINGGGWMEYYNYTPSPQPFTISPGFDHVRITAMRIFVMDKFLNYLNPELKSFNDHVPCSTITCTTNEGNVPFDVHFTFTPALPDGSCRFWILDAMTGAELERDFGKVHFGNPGLTLVRALTINRFDSGGLNWLIVPVFASRFLGAAPPPKLAHLTIHKSDQLGGPWSVFTNFTDVVQGGSQFYRLDISP